MQKIRTTIDVKYFRESVIIEEDLTAPNSEGAYTYRVTHNNSNYIIY